MTRLIKLSLTLMVFISVTGCGQDMTVMRDGICNNNQGFNTKFLPQPVDPDCTTPGFRQ